MRGLSNSGLNKKIQRKIQAAGKKKMNAEVATKVVAKSNRIKNKYIMLLKNHEVVKQMLSTTPSPILGGYGTLSAFFGVSVETARVDIEYLSSLFEKVLVRRSTARGLKTNIQVSINNVIQNKKSEVFDPTSTGGSRSLDGASWVRQMESGLSGFQHFLYDPEAFSNKSYSKSKQGIQIKGKINRSPSSFQPTQFFTKLYNDFIKELTDAIRSDIKK